MSFQEGCSGRQKADWVQIVDGLIQIWSGVSPPVAYWEPRDCTVALTKCGRNRRDVDGAGRKEPGRARTAFKVLPLFSNC